MSCRFNIRKSLLKLHTEDIIIINRLPDFDSQKATLIQRMDRARICMFSYADFQKCSAFEEVQFSEIAPLNILSWKLKNTFKLVMAILN